MDDETLTKIVRRNPAILSYSPLEKIEPNLKWLEENLELRDLPQLQKTISNYPRLIGVNVTSNLKPKLDLLKMCLGDEKGVEYARRIPRSLAVSMKNTLEPRLDQVQKAGIKVDLVVFRKLVEMSKESWDQWLDLNQY